MAVSGRGGDGKRSGGIRQYFFSAYFWGDKQLSNIIDYNSAVLSIAYNKSMKAISKIILILALLISLQCCQVGEFKNSVGKCQQCDISCYTCTSDGCKTCYDQMFPTTRGNTIICELCYNILDGCDVCLTSTKCQNCSAGYYLQADNTCSQCHILFPNCLLCSYGNLTECLGCQAPYEPINGSCFLTGTEGRQPLKPSTTPAASSSNAGQSQQPKASTTVSNKCDPNQVLLQGKCYQAIAFCESYYENNGTCNNCNEGFNLINGYCLPSNLIPPNSENLKQTQPSNPQHSIEQPTCSSRQFGTDGNCFDIGPQCIEFDRSTGTCYLCSSGFEAYNGLCIQQASNLQKESVDNNSQPSDQCGAILPHCLQINPSKPDECQVCCDGYTIVDSIPGKCYSII